MKWRDEAKELNLGFISQNQKSTNAKIRIYA